MRTARLLPVSPSMHCSGGGECTGPGGVPGPRGWCTWSWGGEPGPGGCTWSGGGAGVPGLGGVYLVLGVYLNRGCTWSWGVYLVPGGECTWSWGMYLVPGGVYLPGAGGGGYLLGGGCTCRVGTCPGTPPCEQNDRMTGAKYYLAPNFVCGR